MTTERNLASHVGLRLKSKFVPIAVIGFIWIHVSCFGQWPPILHLRCWSLTNLALFHEVHSTTNLPPDLMKSVGGRVVWAVTDNTNWVVHCEASGPNLTPVPRPPRTNYSISVKLFYTGYTKANGTNQIGQEEAPRIIWNLRAGPFKSYKDFIDYEIELASKLPK